MAFDITKALGDIGRRPAGDGEGRRELRYVPLHMIDTNPRNFYSTDGIDELADNIRLFGLLEPLLVRQEACGRYMLISGHRRRLALRKIAEEAENYPESMHEPVACMVETRDDPLPGIEPGGDAELRARQMAEELKLIYANADTRVMSSADTAQQVRRIRELFTGLQDLGYQFPGKMRDHVAAAAKVSATRVARLDVIEKNLKEPNLRKAWKDGSLQETSAYEIARRSPQIQKIVLQRVGIRPLQGMTTQQVTNCLEACEADENRDREAREDWNKNVRSMAEAAGNGKSDFSADEYLKQRRREDDTFAERLDELFDMFVKDLDYVTDRREGIEFLKRKHGANHHGGSTETGFFACSPKGLTLADDDYEDAITRTWTEVFDELALAALRTVARGKVSAADTEDEGDDLDVEADDDLRIAAAAPAWIQGEPAHDGRYFCQVLIGKDARPHEQRMEWKAGSWHVFGDPADKYEMTVQSWWPLPPEV